MRIEKDLASNITTIYMNIEGREYSFFDRRIGNLNDGDEWVYVYVTDETTYRSLTITESKFMTSFDGWAHVHDNIYDICKYIQIWIDKFTKSVELKDWLEAYENT